MAKVKMLVGVSGSRNGEDYPPVGGVIDVTEQEARDWIYAGLAQAVDKQEPEAKQEPEQATARKASKRA